MYIKRGSERERRRVKINRAWSSQHFFVDFHQKTIFLGTGEQIVDVPVPQVDVSLTLKESVEVVILFPQVRVQRQTNEHTVDMPAHHMLEELVEVRGWSRKNGRNDGAKQISEMVSEQDVEVPLLQWMRG